MAQHRILVIEDDITMRGALGDLLDDEGHDVVTAAHGNEALDVLAAGDDVDLIVLDLSMPEMDAFQFRARQEAMGVGLDARVLVLSGSSDLESAASRIHADRWMEKPADIDALVDAINDLLSANR